MSFFLPIIALMGGLSVDTYSLTAGPVDLTTEWQEVALREPLSARTGNPRLILYIRDLESLGVARKRIVQDLPKAIPRASMSAIVTNATGATFTLEHTGYSFYRGMAGIVLEAFNVPRGETFYKLNVKSAVPVKGVTMAWLDSLGASRPN